MKTCPKCGELNGDNNAVCYKCKTDLSDISTVRRYCKYCKEIYTPSTKECPKCGMPTIEYDPITMSQVHNRKDAAEPWMYVIGFLIPIVGIVLGCIQVGKNDKTGGRNLLILSIISAVIYIIVCTSMASCGAEKIEKNSGIEESISEIYDEEYSSYDYYWD